MVRRSRIFVEATYYFMVCWERRRLAECCILFASGVIRCAEQQNAQPSAVGAAHQSPGWKSARQRALEPWVLGQNVGLALQGRHSCCAALAGMRVKLSIQALKARQKMAPGELASSGLLFKMQRALKGMRVKLRIPALKARQKMAPGELASSDLLFKMQRALKGMRVKLSIPALKARHSKAQGASPGNGMRSNQPCKGGTAAVPPLQGWFHNRPDPGFQPGLCCCALSAPGFVFSSLEAYSQQNRRKGIQH
jgi:hypothetical protein